jgi:hypothetical protein
MKTKSLLLVFFAFTLSPAIQAQDLPTGKAMIWTQPATTPQNLDLFWGSGGEAQKPLGPFTFEKEDFFGTNPKVWVVDQHGIRWGVKFGGESHAEVAASRFLWAAGYRTHIVYFVPEGVIQGATDLKKAGKYIEQGSGRFKNARFQKDLVGTDVTKVVDHFDGWHWDKNPFVGTQELSGLLLINVLIANFDTKASNNRVQTVTYQNGQVENWYMVSDIGGTFGKSDTVASSKWNLKQYAKEPFIENHSSKSLRLFFEGRGSKNFRSIPLEHAQWIDGLIGSLTRAQIEDAFRAAFSDVRVSPLPNPEDEALVKGYTDAVAKRLAALHEAVQSK